MRFTFALGLVVVACSTSTPAPAPGPDLAAEERAVRSADSSWLVAAGSRNAAGEAAMFADDGIAFRDMAEPFTGPAGYQQYLTKYYADNPKATNTWTTRSVQVAASGELAVQIGSFTETGAGPKGDKENRGNFVTVWRKVNGQWKVAADIGQPITPAKP